MPKLCLICGARDEDGCWSTCPCCGEASWMDLGDAKQSVKEDSGDAPGDSADAPGTEQEEPQPESPSDESMACPDCGKVAKSEAGLAAHRRAKHSDASEAS